MIAYQPDAINNPRTPEPALNTLSLVDEPLRPETPVPTSLSPSSPLSHLAFSSSAHTTRKLPQPTATASYGEDSDITEIRQKYAGAEEINGSGRPRFWTVDPDPVEWSPITNVKVNLIPLTADAYLHDKAKVHMTHAEPPSHMFSPEQKEVEHDEEREPGVLALHLRRLLPIVVVILLLLGLLGALLSSFYFPGDKTGAYVMPTHKSVQSVSNVSSGGMADRRTFRIHTLDV